MVFGTLTLPLQLAAEAQHKPRNHAFGVMLRVLFPVDGIAPPDGATPLDRRQGTIITSMNLPLGSLMLQMSRVFSGLQFRRE